MSKVLIIGGTGSWGKALLTRLLKDNDIFEYVIMSRNEYNQVAMSRQFTDKRIKYVVGDIRDYDAVYDACKGVTTVYTLSALKHVPICEEMPLECVKTNVVGVENVIRASLANKVKNCIYVSTDKACYPNTVYGATKLIGERLILNANTKGGTRFKCIRAGNVLGSAGSVVPLFIDQIKKGNHIYVTNPHMTRFFMTLDDAIDLLVQVSKIECQMLVMRMPSCTIGALADAVIQKYGNDDTKITVTGSRPGEKLHESLINEDEAKNAYIWNDDYYILSNTHVKLRGADFTSYSSNNQYLMSVNEVVELLTRGGF